MTRWQTVRVRSCSWTRWSRPAQHRRNPEHPPLCRTLAPSLRLFPANGQHVSSGFRKNFLFSSPRLIVTLPKTLRHLRRSSNPSHEVAHIGCTWKRIRCRNGRRFPRRRTPHTPRVFIRRLCIDSSSPLPCQAFCVSDCNPSVSTETHGRQRGEKKPSPRRHKRSKQPRLVPPRCLGAVVVHPIRHPRSTMPNGGSRRMSYRPQLRGYC